MLSSIIDAMEGRDLANADIPGALLETGYDKGYIHINMEGVMVTIIK